MKARSRRRLDRVENGSLFASRIVLGGPFKGMRYVGQSTGSVYTPKLLGSYEEEISEWIYSIGRNDYDTIVDVGCAEGYYAVGLKLMSPRSEVIAFDIDRGAREMCQELADQNGVLIDIRSEFDPSTFNISRMGKVLLFVDVEGAEIGMLDPERFPWQENVDIIVELHDYMFGYGNNSAILLKALENTHKCEIAFEAPVSLKIKKQKTIFPQISDIEILIDEVRVGKMKWLRALASL